MIPSSKSKSPVIVLPDVPTKSVVEEVAAVPKPKVVLPAAASASSIKDAPNVDTVPEKTGSTPLGVTNVPLSNNLSVSTLPAFIILLLDKSNSACMALGVLPSRDRVLSNPSFKASKLLFRAVVELNPEVTFVIGGVLDISVH